MTTHSTSAAKTLTAQDFHSGATPIWCPGCGDYGVLSALERAFADLGRPPHEIALISGIGCSSRLPAYTTCYGFHGVHGRALPFAAGLKMARPDLEIVAVGGDGDGFSIGGNHFVQACRRNLDMLYLVMDNRVYGMTKGQPSPTTESDWDSDIAPGGVNLPPLQPLSLALAAGATFIGRGFSGHPLHLQELIVEAIEWPGFAFLDVLSPCMAFRSEEFEWKERVHLAARPIEGDRAAAHAALLTDDGYGVGVLFRDPGRSPHAKHVGSTTMAHIETHFQVCQRRLAAE